ncbi:MAG: 2-oxo acid dehydrogenase subunit E2 [Steroidobacteraceae bacterium]
MGVSPDAGFIDITLTPDSYEGNDARLMRWLRLPGETVERDQPLVEIETDKVTVEIAAPASGRLAEVLKEENALIATGDVLGRIAIGAAASTGAPDVAPSGVPDGVPDGLPAREPATVPAGSPAAQAVPAASRAPEPRAATGEQRLSPAVRTLLANRSLSPRDLKGSGLNGRLTAKDVERHVREAPEDGAPAGQRRPLSAMRRRIAANLQASVSSVPHATAVFEVDLGAVIDHRQRHRAAFAQRGIPLTYTAYFLAACVPAMAAVPEVNARFHADALELFDELNIGVGTALGNEGLVVPVLRNLQSLDLAGIAGQLEALVDKARKGALLPKDIRGGTFTISNHGVSGSLIATPIIPPGQVAILGIGKLERRPVVRMVEGVERLEAASRCFVTLTIDHRALDGFQANAFLSAWVSAIEGWPAG